MPFFRLPPIFYTHPSPDTARVAYGKKPMQFYNIRVPKPSLAQGPRICILIHGGMWKKTYTHKQMEYLAEDLQNRGVTTVNIEFIRHGHVGGNYTASMNDLNNALSHYIATYPPAAPISIIGHSSGAHLAFCLASMSNQTIKFKNCIGLSGVYDLTAPKYQTGKPRDLIQSYFNGNPVSPLNLSPCCPVSLITGDQDKLLLQAEQYLKHNQSRHTVNKYIIPNCDHFGTIDPTHPSWDTTINTIMSII